MNGKDFEELGFRSYRDQEKDFPRSHTKIHEEFLTGLTRLTRCEACYGCSEILFILSILSDFCFVNLRVASMAIVTTVVPTNPVSDL